MINLARQLREVVGGCAALDEGTVHERSLALMKFLSGVAKKSGVAKHVYVVGGAVRDFYIDQPIKDIDVVIDPTQTKGKDSAWFAKKIAKAVPGATSLVTNQYGVAILTIKGPWKLDGHNMKGEVIEVANSRSESYGGAAGKGYKPSEVKPADIRKDVFRREFTFNTLMWRMADLAKGPDKKDIIDITGCGIRDLESGELRCPSNPDKTFSDDPTRMLRAIKFMVRFGFKVVPEVAVSIRRNAHLLKSVPYEAVAKLLVDTILKESKYKNALKAMKELGLLEVVADMIRNNPSFHSTMNRWVSHKKVAFMFDLMDMGLPLSAPMRFLSKTQQAGLRMLALRLPKGEPERLLAVLKQPGKLMDMQGLIKELGLSGKQIGTLTDIAQDLLLDNPDLLNNGALLTKRVLEVYKK